MSASQQRLYWRLQLAAHYMQKHADRELLEQSAITTAQIGVLSAIANRDNVTQKTVADALGLNESAISAMVRKLIASGLIERSASDLDRRAKLLRLTSKGRSIQNSVKPPFKEINKRIEAELNSDEINALADYLTRLGEAFRN